jgi:hypothetical protein
MSETDAVMVIRDGQLSNGLQVVYVLTVLRDARTIEETARRCQVPEDDIDAVLSFAATCITRCRDVRGG